MLRRATRTMKPFRAFEERRDGMKRGEIKALLRSLARSQGMYGRLLRDIESMDKVDQEDFWSELEAQNFKDELDVVMYFENGESRKRRLESKKRSLMVPCILKENRRRRCEDATDGLSDAVDVIEGKDTFNARALKFEIRTTNGMMQNGKFVGKVQASLTMSYEGAECSISLTDVKAEMTIQEMPDVTTQIYSAVVSLPTSRRDATIEREGNGYTIRIGADCHVTCRETNMDGRDLCYCKFTFHITNKKTVGKLSAWILEGVDDSVKKRGGGRRGRGGSLAGMIDLDMFPDGTTYGDIEYALNSGDFSMLF